jgi:hypothetical protein
MGLYPAWCQCPAWTRQVKARYEQRDARFGLVAEWPVAHHEAVVRLLGHELKLQRATAVVPRQHILAVFPSPASIETHQHLVARSARLVQCHCPVTAAAYSPRPYASDGERGGSALQPQTIREPRVSTVHRASAAGLDGLCWGWVTARCEAPKSPTRARSPVQHVHHVTDGEVLVVVGGVLQQRGAVAEQRARDAHVHQRRRRLLQQNGPPVEIVRARPH